MDPGNDEDVLGAVVQASHGQVGQGGVLQLHCGNAGVLIHGCAERLIFLMMKLSSSKTGCRRSSTPRNFSAFWRRTARYKSAGGAYVLHHSQLALQVSAVGNAADNVPLRIIGLHHAHLAGDDHRACWNLSLDTASEICKLPRLRFNTNRDGCRGNAQKKYRAGQGKIGQHLEIVTRPGISMADTASSSSI